MPPLDYKELSLKSKNTAVDSFCVASLLAEYALVASLEHGLRALGEQHLPVNLLMTLDGYTGQQAVKTYDQVSVQNKRAGVLLLRARSENLCPCPLWRVLFVSLYWAP